MDELEGVFGAESFRSQPLAVKAEWLYASVARMLEVLSAFFEGYIISEDEGANRVYLLLRRISEILAKDFPDVEIALQELTDVFPNLYEAIGEPDVPEEKWEFLGPPVITSLKARLSEAVMDAGTAPPDDVRKAVQSGFSVLDEDIAASFVQPQTRPMPRLSHDPHKRGMSRKPRPIWDHRLSAD